MTVKGQEEKIKNEGQKVIFAIRKAYEEGSLAVIDNIAPEVQVMLNRPTSIKSKSYKVDPKDQAFLADLIDKVDKGKVKLFTPSSLLNQKVYESLSKEVKAKADYDILVLLHKIRQVKKLWDSGSKDSYQIMNLVHSLRLNKEALEEMEGDVFII
jgi:U3 small nucleolar RNA-associated protein 14